MQILTTLIACSATGIGVAVGIITAQTPLGAATTAGLISIGINCIGFSLLWLAQ